MEVDEQAERLVRQPEIGDHLGEVKIVDSPDGFQFEDDAILDHQIDAMRRERPALVLADKADLLGKANAYTLKLRTQRGFIYRFQQAHSKLPMHLDRATDHSPAQIIQRLGKLNPFQPNTSFFFASSA